MKNTTALIGIIAIVVIAAIFIFANSGSATITEKNVGSNTNVQTVKLSVQGGSYVMNPSSLKKGVPVRIEADMSNMPGCSRSVVISAFNIRKNFAANDNILEFTPDKAGTFNIACSMNMYRGTFTVLENDGTKPVYVEQPSSTQQGSTCGMANGGGCGCGG